MDIPEAPLQRLTSFEIIKLLSDPRRLRILQQLMAGPASLTGLGQALGEHPAWIRHHLKQLEAAGLVEPAGLLRERGVIEKLYRARSRAWLVEAVVLPGSGDERRIVAIGSHDLALDLLARSQDSHLLPLAAGSLNGLIALRQGLTPLSGIHLLDAVSGEYNRSYVRHFFPGEEMLLLTLAERAQGLMLAPGNPKGIRSLADLARGEVTFVNRNPGSGTRLWLDHALQGLGIPPQSVHGYEQAVATHTGTARLVQSGAADAGLGLMAAARSCDLDFLPLFEERYDLVLHAEHASLPALRSALDNLQSAAFRRQVSTLDGYAVRHTGEETLIH